jgi:hypothetical protein
MTATFDIRKIVTLRDVSYSVAAAPGAPGV